MDYFEPAQRRKSWKLTRETCGFDMKRTHFGEINIEITWCTYDENGRRKSSWFRVLGHIETMEIIDDHEIVDGEKRNLWKKFGS